MTAITSFQEDWCVGLVIIHYSLTDSLYTILHGETFRGGGGGGGGVALILQNCQK